MGKESRTRAPFRRPRTAFGRFAAGLGLAGALIVPAGCGGGDPRQDAADPSGDFPVSITAASFPNRQRLAQTSDLVLEVENTGEEVLPELAVTIYVNEGTNGSFSVRLQQPGLANPDRPVWILEDHYPTIVGEELAKGSSAATAAQTNTFSFGELEPGESREMLWKVTPVMAGTFTVNYEISASLTGKAKAVTEGGEQPKGKFVVTIDDTPPKAHVTESGEVEIIEPGSGSDSSDEGASGPGASGGVEPEEVEPEEEEEAAAGSGGVEPEEEEAAAAG